MFIPENHCKPDPEPQMGYRMDEDRRCAVYPPFGH